MLLAITVLEISSGQTDRQTDKQTDRQTNATENSTSPISSAEVKIPNLQCASVQLGVQERGCAQRTWEQLCAGLQPVATPRREATDQGEVEGRREGAARREEGELCWLKLDEF